MKIHHNTLKRAAAHGINLMAVDEGGLVFGAFSVQSGDKLAEAADPRDALDLALAEIEPVKLKTPKAKKPRKATPKRKRAAGDEDGEGDEDDEGDEDGEGDDKSVVKRKYKQAYRPHKMTCGDQLAQQIRAEFMTVKDPDTKKMRLDWKRLTVFAKANGCWSDSYLKLNKGMRRMNIVNRLRAKVEAGEEIKWIA